MATYKASLLAKLHKFFCWSTEQIEQYDEDDMGYVLTAEAEEASQQGGAERDELWSSIRDMTIRGNAAGTIAALTAFGSQSLTGKAPRVILFFTIATFIVGLGAIFAQKFIDLMIKYNKEIVKINFVFDHFELSHPPAVWQFSVRTLDWLAVVFLIAGIGMGLLVLLSMTYVN